MDLVIRIAMRALARNKLRSILHHARHHHSVGAVIAMVSVGQGAQQQAQQQDRGYGIRICSSAIWQGEPRRNEYGVGSHQDADL